MEGPGTRSPLMRRPGDQESSLRLPAQASGAEGVPGQTFGTPPSSGRHLGDTDGPLTVGQLYREATSESARTVTSSRQKPYRWWRVTLNQRSVHKLRKVAVCTNPMSTPDDMTAEVTSFLSLARQSNWLVIDQLSAAFSNAAVLFGFQLVLWIAAAAVVHLHGVGAPPHK